MPLHRFASTAHPAERPLLAPLWLIALLAAIVGVALFLLYPRTDLERRLAETPDTALSASYLANLLRSDPDNPRLRLLLARRQAEIGKTMEARATLQPALDTTDREIHQQAEWVLWELNAQDYRLLPAGDSPARRALLAELLSQIEKLADAPLTVEQQIELASKAYLLEQPVLGARLFKSVGQRIDNPAEAVRLYEHAAVKALANGDYSGSAELYLLARNSSSDPLLAKRYFHTALRTLQSGNLMQEAIEVGKRDLGALVDDQETLLLLTRLARAAGRPDIADRYVRLLLRLALMRQWQRLEIARAWGDGSFRAVSQQAPQKGPGIAFDDKIYTLGYEIFLENRKLEDAWQVASSAVRQMPDDNAWRERLARVSEWTGRPQVALENWVKLAHAGHGDDAWQSVLRLAPGLFDDAALIPALHYQIERRPGDLRLVRELLAAHERLGEPGPAISYLERLSRQRFSPEVLEMLAEVAERAGRVDLAVETWERLFAVPEQLTPARALRVAVMLLIQGRHSESLVWLERAQTRAGTASEEEIEYWRLNGQLAELHAKDNQAIDAFRRIIDADKANAGDFDALIRLLVQAAPLDAASVSADAWEKFDEPRYLIQALTIYAGRNRWADIGKLLQRIDTAPGASRHALAQLRALPDFLRLLGTYQQNIGQFALARGNFEAGLLLAPDAADLQQALLWLFIDGNDAAALRKVLATHERNWAKNPAMHDALASSYQALSLPQVALQRYLTPRTGDHRNDLLWMMNYADALDQNQQGDLAWRLRRLLLSEEWDSVRGKDSLRQARQRWLSEEGLDETRRIARTRLMLTQRPGNPGLDVLREMLRLDRSERDSFSNAAAETAIGWLQDHAEYGAERAFLWHQYAKTRSSRANRPLWAEITVALAERDTAAIGQLLETFDERLPRYDRVNAARAVDDLRLAQSAAFEAQSDQTDDNPTHLQLTETLLAFSDHGGFAIASNNLDSIVETESTAAWHLAVNPRLALDFDWGRIRREVRNREVIRAAPDEDVFSARLNWRHADGETIFRIDRRESFATYTPVQIEHEHRIDDRLSLRIGLGSDLPSQESQPLRIAGMKDRASFSLRYRPTRMDQVLVEHWRENYYLQTGARLGDGRHSSVTLAHTYRQEARDLEFSAFWSKHEFNRVGDYSSFSARDARIEQIFPAGFVSPGGNEPPAADYYLPENFSFYGIRVSTDVRHEREYTRATRPFASIARTWHSELGAGYDIRLGLAGSVLGADHLALSWGLGKAGTQTNAPVRDLRLTYRIHY
ncbi:tetratricopeptide repeat protein [Azonexus hydrophilus]|uniref:tetratricopeptide repeat protein n=1 Tax=Azonexus hydrophilus TaxID=418702 RepID=UPI0009F95874|nr:tetratricopeptide repeat protein [Azonexus hydrophilus]